MFTRVGVFTPWSRRPGAFAAPAIRRDAIVRLRPGLFVGPASLALGRCRLTWCNRLDQSAPPEGRRSNEEPGPERGLGSITLAARTPRAAAHGMIIRRLFSLRLRSAPPYGRGVSAKKK